MFKKLLCVAGTILVASGAALAQSGQLSQGQVWGNFSASAGPSKPTNLMTFPVVSGNLACFSGTTGLLQDCGIGTASRGLTLSPTAGLNPAINSTQTVTGTATSPFAANQLTINDAAVINGATFDGLYGFQITHNLNSALVRGQRFSSYVTTAFTQTSSPSTPAAARAYTSMGTLTYANANDNGTNPNSGSLGLLTGYNANVQMRNGATNWAGMQGVEIDMTAEAGTSFQTRAGLNFVLGTNDRVQGTLRDTALLFQSADTLSPGFKTLFDIDAAKATGASSPISSTGTVMIARNTLGGAGPSFQDGIDFSGAQAITGCAFKSLGGFCINGGGDVNARLGFFAQAQNAQSILEMYNNNTGASAQATVRVKTGTANANATFSVADQAGNPYSYIATDLGVNQLHLRMNGTTIETLTKGGGAQFGAPTGGDQGVGAVNAQALYQNGVAAVITDGAWTTYTPTFSCGTGTVTTLGTNTGRYRFTGKTYDFETDTTITTVGTCAGVMNIGLPNGTTLKANFTAVGRESAINGKMLYGALNTSSGVAAVLDYSGVTIAASGARIVLTGRYEAN
jgi:hypothetical protein